MSTAEIVDEKFKQIGAELSNWGRWGADDQVGTLNFITPAVRAAAAKMIKTGETVDLGMPLDANGPHSGREWRFNPIHRMTQILTDVEYPGGAMAADDVISMPLQAGTQWDALAHVGYDGEIYNGYPATSMTAVDGATKNSFDRVVDRIVGRGVLLDIARLRGVDVMEGGDEITPDDLDRAARTQGVEVRTGDILLVRTGWYQHFLNGDHGTFLGPDEAGMGFSTCAWLDEHQVAAIAADNFAVEVRPSGIKGVLAPVHMVLIRDLGMTLGEMFNLEILSETCARLGRWEFFLSGIGMKVSGSVGSPVNPIAIF